MNNKQLILIMKAVNGQNPGVNERDLWRADGNHTEYSKTLEKVVAGLDANPLFDGKHKPTNSRWWNTWHYIGPKKFDNEE